jgi:hypothetical protein
MTPQPLPADEVKRALSDLGVQSGTANGSLNKLAFHEKRRLPRIYSNPNAFTPEYLAK